jgi:hypothetical protein
VRVVGLIIGVTIALVLSLLLLAGCTVTLVALLVHY